MCFHPKMVYSLSFTDPYHCVGSIDDGGDHQRLIHHWALLLFGALPVGGKSRQGDSIYFVPGSHLGQVVLLKQVEKVQRKLTPSSPSIKPDIACQAGYVGEPHEVGDGGPVRPRLREGATLDAHGLQVLSFAHLAQGNRKQVNSII